VQQRYLTDTRSPDKRGIGAHLSLFSTKSISTGLGSQFRSPGVAIIVASASIARAADMLLSCPRMGVLCIPAELNTTMPL
jgi:hypothetical protein